MRGRAGILRRSLKSHCCINRSLYVLILYNIMSAISSSPQSILGTARVTVAFTSVYIVSLCYQIICKKRLLRKARLKGEPFNRYGHPELHNADRLVANILEWSPIFLCPLWCLAVTDRLDQSCKICCIERTVCMSINQIWG